MECKKMVKFSQEHLEELREMEGRMYDILQEYQQPNYGELNTPVGQAWSMLFGFLQGEEVS